MDTYLYETTAGVFRLPIASYEARLLSRLYTEPPPVPGVLRVNRRGRRVTIPCDELCADATRLLAVLTEQGERLQYRYSIARSQPDGRWGPAQAGGFTCRFRGQAVLAEAGPGYCHVKVASFVSVPQAATASPPPLDLSGPALAIHHEVLHDLRDMQPLQLDSGEQLRPGRRRRATDLPNRIRALVQFAADGGVGPLNHWLE